MTFVLCMFYEPLRANNNKRYRRRLKLHVIYQAMRSDKGWRLVDESGVMREYSERYFVPIELSAELAATFPDMPQSW